MMFPLFFQFSKITVGNTHVLNMWILMSATNINQGCYDSYTLICFPCTVSVIGFIFSFESFDTYASYSYIYVFACSCVLNTCKAVWFK